jgi:protein-S-isoprenylcysteine O-methyltransferase Ste14
MWLVACSAPALALTRWPAREIAAVCVAAAGLVVGIAGVISFRRARTTVSPITPEMASSLVVSGLYRRTRNPMYLGMLLVLSAWALFLSNPIACVFLPAFILYLNKFQIEPEEAALASLFGPEFTAYKTTVRRWL